jgi:hypothetical protein
VKEKVKDFLLLRGEGVPREIGVVAPRPFPLGGGIENMIERLGLMPHIGPFRPLVNDGPSDNGEPGGKRGPLWIERSKKPASVAQKTHENLLDVVIQLEARRRQSLQ